MKRACLLLILLTACETDPPPTDGGLRDAAVGVDAGPIEAPACEGLAVDPPAVSCDALPTDYSPGADDMWPPCISDDGTYHRILPDISTIERVMAYDEMRALLFDPARDPTPDDFLEARLVYQRDEGLDSRVVRRYDPHYTVPDGTDCTLPGAPDMYPDYCVGPAQLLPLALDNLNAGIEGVGPEIPRVRAARVEAALDWFLAVSTYKESLTCTRTAKDCDSSYAYYTGGETARGGIGLAARVMSVDPLAHDRAWDGLLGVRCWRDLDPDEVATDVGTRDRARAQYDRAVLDGVAAMLRSRLVRSCGSQGRELLAHWEYARVLGGFLDREARARDPMQADILAGELAHPQPGDADVTRIVNAIDALFVCP